MNKVLEDIEKWYKNEDDLQDSYDNLSQYLSEIGYAKHVIYDTIEHLASALVKEGSFNPSFKLEYSESENSELLKA